MLGQTPIIAFIPTRDAAQSRAFYEDLLGLRFVDDDKFALVMEANGTMIRIVRVGNFTPAPFTILGWEVKDIHQSVADLTAKGLVFTRYPHFEQSPDGVWTAPGGAAKVAWFTDPDGNTLSLSQH
ncbi:VOC family protein [Tunturiibacter gelidoferens]|uniref:Catechol 2,3-dioxygenase-like lactoylglutathione lyase family enzyme n=3 Tax=Tunturiibacter TaxID=3154218 RepID=A0A7Y9NIR5_9BACT|nr:VOC family protein [Edaphobacter lichenicola]MBB5340626.1 catechol 2,3-dioxygenase-like lactoylglutathione lyase family enzyme [Edaphobacter lichenicola]NYF50058.1 catechol 2,3-dioxygenase-like lactoylglutathione lyase family enzyme [Edaphobacter lichenicola]